MSTTTAKASAYSPPTPYQATWLSVLSQDLVMTDKIPVDSTTSGSAVAVFRNKTSGGRAGNEQTEALVIANLEGAGGAAARLCHVKRDYSTDAGWRLETLFKDRIVNAVTAGTAYAGTTASEVHGIFQDETGLHAIGLSAADGAAWSQPQQITTLKLHGLKSCYTPSGALVVYGSTDQGDLFTAVQQVLGGPFTGNVCVLDGALLSGKYCLTFTDTATWTLAVNENGKPALYIGELGEKEYSSKGLADGFQGTLSDICLGFWNGAQNTLSYLFIDTSNKLHIWSTNSAASGPISQQIEGSTITVAAGHISSTDGTVHLYGVDDKQTLWAVHQDIDNPWDDNGYPNWSPCLPLDTGVAALASDFTPADAPALFALDAADYSLRLHSQDAVTGMWNSGTVHQAGEKSYEVVRFRTELTLRDANGVGVSNHPVSLQPAEGSSSAELWCGGAVHQVTSTKAAALSTDAAGKLTIATLATSGLAAPELHLTADGLTAPLRLQPAAHLHDYFAGKGTLHPTNPHGELPVFDADGTALAQASIGGQPLAPGVQGNGNLAKTAAGAIRQTALSAGQTGSVVQGVSQASQEQQPIAGYAADFSNPEEPSFILFHSAEELEAHQQQRKAALQAEGLGSIWGDIGKWAGDVWEAVKNGVAKLSNFVVDAAKKIASVTLKIGDVIAHDVQLAIHGLEQAGHFIAGVFQAIAADIGKLIDWLKALFDFGAIWRTKKAFEEGILSIPPYVKQVLKLGQKAADGFFAKQISRVDSSFEQMKAKYAGVSFSGLAGWQPVGQPPDSKHRLVGKATAADFTDNTHHNWLHDKVSSYTPSSSGIAPSQEVQSPWEAFVSNMEASGKDFLGALEILKDSLGDVIKNPASIGEMALPAFLGFVQKMVDAVLHLTDAIIDGLIELGDIVMDAMTAFLSHELHLGPINTLWSWIADAAGYPDDDKLTVAAMMSLLVAFPTTVIYKLIEGTSAEPFPDGRFPKAGSSAKWMAEAGHPLLSDMPRGAKIASAVVQILVVIPVMYGDAKGPDCPWWVSSLSIVMSGISWGLSNGLPDLDAMDWTIAAVVGVKLASLAYVFYFVIQSSTSVVATFLKNNTYDIGQIGLSLYGLGRLILNVYNSIAYPTSGYRILANILLPLPCLFAVYNMNTIRKEPLAPVFIGAVEAIDFVGYVAGGACLLVDAIEAPRALTT
ncbi:hypothetical protein G5B47_12625 [Paenibacillus sp. 7124]|uniref:Uncharacterized protein n=1 Tax=Paenibacillus apii TaxID=1850370 RepID=A0A6M1PJ89_9BACL|nr:hypothetical protein [Paenibacillus apii]NGM83260.1 hypothetical protein [Paenibacillus apii]NJJ38908.1 hypothetical protein [Paenibacillus apii]